MRITFHGAAQEVTGSMQLIEVNGRRLLLECGFWQGRRADTYERNLRFPFDPVKIDALVLTHAHIDHSGNIPNLVKQGFRGNIWCTSATRNLCAYMLVDSGHIQEQDAEYVNKQRKKKGEEPIEPLYTQADAVTALEQIIGIPRRRTIDVVDGVKLTFFDAGHILGSAFAALDIQDNDTGKRTRLIYSGDIGRHDAPILCSPEPVAGADVLIMESTYGDRLHGTPEDAQRRLRDIVQETVRRRGKLIIPAFAVGRTQELVYALNQLESDGHIPGVKVFVDSPLAVNATEVFRMHPEDWDEDVREFMTEDANRRPFDFSRLEYVRDQRRSRQLNFMTEPAIIISASGMAENGRILHHLKNGIGDSHNTVLFVGYQAENTLGRRIKDGRSPVRIFGDEYKVRARVVSIDGYSAHADQAELVAWACTANPERLQRTFLIHGEPEATTVLAGKLDEKGFQNLAIPERAESYEL